MNESNKKIIAEKLNLEVKEVKSGLSVSGTLYLHGTAITELPDNLSVGGSLYLRGTAITELPDNLSVGGSLDLRGTAITELPDNLSVGGSLHLEGTITELPDNLSVGGSLCLEPEKQTSISAYRKNCGKSSRTIYTVFIGGEFKIKAGCFFGTFAKFCIAVKRDYSGKSADTYIAKAQKCIDELAKKLNKKQS